MPGNVNKRIINCTLQTEEDSFVQGYITPVLLQMEGWLIHIRNYVVHI